MFIISTHRKRTGQDKDMGLHTLCRAGKTCSDYNQPRKNEWINICRAKPKTMRRNHLNSSSPWPLSSLSKTTCLPNAHRKWHNQAVDSTTIEALEQIHEDNHVIPESPSQAWGRRKNHGRGVTILNKTSFSNRCFSNLCLPDDRWTCLNQVVTDSKENY